MVDLSSYREELVSRGALRQKNPIEEPSDDAPLCKVHRVKRLRCKECDDFTICPVNFPPDTCYPCVDKAIVALKAFHKEIGYGQSLLQDEHQQVGSNTPEAS